MFAVVGGGYFAGTLFARVVNGVWGWSTCEGLRAHVLDPGVSWKPMEKLYDCLAPFSKRL